MKILIIGLGSMGKRRIRNFKELNINDIYGFDINNERTQYVYKNINMDEEIVEVKKVRRPKCKIDFLFNDELLK